MAPSNNNDTSTTALLAITRAFLESLPCEKAIKALDKYIAKNDITLSDAHQSLPTLEQLYLAFIEQQSKQDETASVNGSSNESQTGRSDFNDDNNSINSSNNNNAKNNKKQSSTERFKRVREEEVEFVDERLKDNSFLAKSGASDSYGYKAHQDLIVTRGKGFTKEKNKKKKGSYRGGRIDTQSHSIKFSHSDDE